MTDLARLHRQLAAERDAIANEMAAEAQERPFPDLSKLRLLVWCDHGAEIVARILRAQDAAVTAYLDEGEVGLAEMQAVLEVDGAMAPEDAYHEARRACRRRASG